MVVQLELFKVIQYATAPEPEPWEDYDDISYSVCIDIAYLYDDDDYAMYNYISQQYGVTPLFL